VYIQNGNYFLNYDDIDSRKDYITLNFEEKVFCIRYCYRFFVKSEEKYTISFSEKRRYKKCWEKFLIRQSGKRKEHNFDLRFDFFITFCALASLNLFYKGKFWLSRPNFEKSVILSEDGSYTVTNLTNNKYIFADDDEQSSVLVKIHSYNEDQHFKLTKASENLIDNNKKDTIILDHKRNIRYDINNYEYNLLSSILENVFPCGFSAKNVLGIKENMTRYQWEKFIYCHRRITKSLNIRTLGYWKIDLNRNWSKYDNIVDNIIKSLENLECSNIINDFMHNEQETLEKITADIKRQHKVNNSNSRDNRILKARYKSGDEDLFNDLVDRIEKVDLLPLKIYKFTEDCNDEYKDQINIFDNDIEKLEIEIKELNDSEYNETKIDIEVLKKERDEMIERWGTNMKYSRDSEKKSRYNYIVGVIKNAKKNDMESRDKIKIAEKIIKLEKCKEERKKYIKKNRYKRKEVEIETKIVDCIQLEVDLRVKFKEVAKEKRKNGDLSEAINLNIIKLREKMKNNKDIKLALAKKSLDNYKRILNELKSDHIYSNSRSKRKKLKKKNVKPINSNACVINIGCLVDKDSIWKMKKPTWIT